ncbi:hypothetical protein Tco_1376917 [Tanacetum coccineum]
MFDEKLTLVDDDGKPLYKAESTVNADSGSEMKEVFNETASLIGYGIDKFKKVNDDYDMFKKWDGIGSGKFRGFVFTIPHPCCSDLFPSPSLGKLFAIPIPSPMRIGDPTGFGNFA